MSGIISLCVLVLVLFPLSALSQRDTVAVLFNSSSLSVAEGSSVGIQVIAQGTYNRGFTVNLTFHDGSAILLRDYLYPGYPTVTPSVTFAPGSLSSSVFTVIAIGNNAFDGQRSFTVRFELPDVPGLHLRQGRPNRLSVSIIDNDFVAVSFERPSQEVDEDIGSISVQLQSKGFYSKPFDVSFTCSEIAPVEAEDGADFISKVHTVTFDATGIEKTVSTVEIISILDDRISEATESFCCVILPRSLDGIVVEVPYTLALAILDDDSADVTEIGEVANNSITRPAIKFEHAMESRTEGSFYCIHLIAVGVFEEDFSVKVKLVPLTAHHIADYSLLPPNLASDTTYANFTVGQINSTTVCILLINNNAWEPLESFQIRIEIPSGVKAMKGSPSTLTVNIIDNDEVHISFADSSLSIPEDIRQLRLKLVADGIYTDVFSVNIKCLEVNPVEAEVTNAITNTSDVYPASFNVQFTDIGRLTSTSTDFIINIVDDLITEQTESFNCIIIIQPCGATATGISVISPYILTVSILDNDILEVGFEKQRYTGMEGTWVNVQLVASDLVQFVRPFQARIFSSSFPRNHHLKKCEADEGEDYTSPSDSNLDRGLVDFDPSLGFTSTRLFIPLVSDGIVECASECFSLNFVFEEDFANPSPLELKVGSPSSATVCIRDKDMMFLRFVKTSYSVREDAGSVSIRLEAVQEDPENPGSYIPAKYTAVCEVTCRTVAGSAEANLDYIHTTGKVEFSLGMQFSTPFQVDIVDNEILECPEEFTIKFRVTEECKARVKFLNSDKTTVSIIDDRDPLVRFAAPRIDAYEGTKISVQVYRVGRIQQKQAISVQVEQNTARQGLDFRLKTRSLVFKKLESSVEVKNVMVEIKEDNLSEGPEMFSIVLDSGGGSPCSQQKLPVTILEV